MQTTLNTIDPVVYVGKKANTPLAYHYYNPQQIILGKPLEEHLRFSASYWQTYCWENLNNHALYWEQTIDPRQIALKRVPTVFEFIKKLGLKFFSFHDLDLAPQGRNLQETSFNLHLVAEQIAKQMQHTGINLLAGTANLRQSSRYQHGAATNYDPYVFSYAVSQVKLALDITHQLKGKNYILWIGCEGYESLLNTDIQQELAQLANFLLMLVDYKYKIGFKGQLLIEPKLYQLSNHQYYYDTAAVLALLQKHQLEKEFKINIQANHITLASHNLAFEVAYALANHFFGGIDVDPSTPSSSWHMDLLPSHLSELIQVIYLFLQNDGFGCGGFNFDNAAHRRNMNLVDILYGYVSAIDILAKAFISAADLIEAKKLERSIATRYQGWQSALGADILKNNTDFEKIANIMMTHELENH